GEAIAAENEGVAGGERDRVSANVHLDGRRDPERAQNPIRIWMTDSLLWREHACVDHLLHDGVILRERDRLTLADEITTAVANVRDDSARSLDHREHDRRARARCLIGRRERIDA